MKVFAVISAFIVALGINFGIDAAIAYGLSRLFTDLMSFWQWFWCVFVVNWALGTALRRNDA
ncbi:hypothetical protein [Kitasatospora aureofaciens]|uniref:hypothetical protein n=1 Tax=Kitasatospora aureofaciens TaxID=1894 RepID=UPI0033D6F726